MPATTVRTSEVSFVVGVVDAAAVAAAASHGQAMLLAEARAGAK